MIVMGFQAEKDLLHWNKKVQVCDATTASWICNTLSHNNYFLVQKIASLWLAITKANCKLHA
jgi:hypothetical protein